MLPFTVLFQDVMGTDENLYIHMVVRRREEDFGLSAVFVIEVSCSTCQHHLYPWLPSVNTWHNLETHKVLLLLLLFTLYDLSSG